jgi:hypothetical protein
MGSNVLALESSAIILAEVLGESEAGCDFWTPQGEFQNAHIAIGVGIQTDDAGNAEVEVSSFQLCEDPESGIFGPHQELPENLGPVSMGAGLDGFHAVELELPAPFEIEPDVNQVRLGVWGENELGETFFIDSTQPDNDAPIVLGFGGPEAISVPVSGIFALSILAGGLLLLGLVYYSRRSGKLLILLVAVSGGGLIAQSGGFQFDWDDPPLAESPAPDPDDGVHVRALFAKLVDLNDDPRLAFRLDMALEPDTLVVNASPDTLTLFAGGVEDAFVLEHNSADDTVSNITADLSGTALEGQVVVTENTCDELPPVSDCYLLFDPGEETVPRTEFYIQGDNMEPIVVAIEVID